MFIYRLTNIFDLGLGRCFFNISWKSQRFCLKLNIKTLLARVYQMHRNHTITPYILLRELKTLTVIIKAQAIVPKLHKDFIVVVAVFKSQITRKLYYWSAKCINRFSNMPSIALFLTFKKFLLYELFMIGNLDLNTESFT